MKNPFAILVLALAMPASTALAADDKMHPPEKAMDSATPKMKKILTERKACTHRKRRWTMQFRPRKCPRGKAPRLQANQLRQEHQMAVPAQAFPTGTFGRPAKASI